MLLLLLLKLLVLLLRDTSRGRLPRRGLVQGDRLRLRLVIVAEDLKPNVG